MKRSLAVLLCLLFAVQARSEIGFGGGGHAGFSLSSFPQGISDFYGSGFLFGAHGDLNIMKYVGARMNLDYSIYSSNKDKIVQAIAPGSGATISGLNINVFSISVNGLGKIPTASPLTPYGLFGFGIHIMSVSDGKAELQGQTFDLKLGLGSQTKFGLNFGAGTEFALSAAKLYFEFKYVLIFTEGNSTGLIPLVVGVTFGG